MAKSQSDSTCRSRTVGIHSDFVLADDEIQSAYADGRGAIEFGRRVESLVLKALRTAKAEQIACPCAACACARAVGRVEEVAMFEIVGPGGVVHYRRPAGDPMLEDARKTPGYSVRPVNTR